MPGPTVLVVEDDANIADLVDLYLRQAGYDVARAPDGERGLRLAAARAPALVILDVGLPGRIDGLEVARRIRGDLASSVPVLLLTARGEESDRLAGFDIGADDYVTKPFSPRELVARVTAILRRAAGNGTGAPRTGVIRFGDVQIDLGRLEARRGGGVVALAPRELALLVALVDNRGLVLSRRQLLDLAWGHEFYGDERTVDVHVRQLRRKLGDDLPLVTLRGAGYRLG
jgi:two-component system response regulator ResD